MPDDPTHEPPTPDASTPDAAPGPPPLAFTQGVGLLMQTVGMVLFLSMCCVCSLGGFWEDAPGRAETIRALAEEPSSITYTMTNWREDPAGAGAATMLFFTTIGGLAMATFGLGLQAKRTRAAVGAVVTNALVIVVLLVAGVGLWTGDGGAAMRLWHALLSLVMLLTLAFSVAAVREIRATPPPPDIDVLPKDYKVPYSHLNQDPPDIRLEREIESRRAKLAEEARKIEELESTMQEKRESRMRDEAHKARGKMPKDDEPDA